MDTQGQISPMVQAIGNAATMILSSHGHGSVLASVSGAIYLRTDEDEVCWLIPVDAPMHQRAIKVSGNLPSCKAGDRYMVQDNTLVIGSAISLGIHQSKTWKSALISVDGAFSSARLVDALDQLVDRLLMETTPAGFGYFIAPILHLVKGKSSVGYQIPANQITEKAWTEVQGLVLAGLKQDTEAFLLHAKAMVGLGEGLTPSGDDFLGGFFYTQQCLRSIYPGLVDNSSCTYSDFIHSSKPLTNLISYTMLTDHVEGHSVESMHQLTQSLLTGSSTDVHFSHTRQLVSLGHSTGWDLFTGFLIGALIPLT